MTPPKPQLRRRTAKPPARHDRHPGVLRAGEQHTIELRSELLPNESPVVFTPKPGQVLVQPAGPRSVTVENTTEHVVLYVLVIVPTKMVRLALVDWRHVLQETKRGLAAIPFFQRLLKKD